MFSLRKVIKFEIFDFFSINFLGCSKDLKKSEFKKSGISGFVSCSWDNSLFDIISFVVFSSDIFLFLELFIIFNFNIFLLFFIIIIL